MATTFIRIRTLLSQARRQPSWESINELATDVRRRRLVAFRLRGDGSSIDHYMSIRSISRMINLMRDLELIRSLPGGLIQVTPKGANSLSSEDAFARQIRSSVKSLLQKKQLPLSTITQTILGITLPDVPNPETIYEALPVANPPIDRETFRKLLYLLACSDGIERSIKVLYT